MQVARPTLRLQQHDCSRTLVVVGGLFGEVVWGGSVPRHQSVFMGFSVQPRHAESRRSNRLTCCPRPQLGVLRRAIVVHDGARRDFLSALRNFLGAFYGLCVSLRVFVRKHDRLSRELSLPHRRARLSSTR